VPVIALRTCSAYIYYVPGDFVIQHESTRVFAIFYIYGCVLVFAVAFNNVLDEIIEEADAERTEEQQRKFLATRDDSEAWVTSLLGNSVNTPGCSKEAFILSVLSNMRLRCSPYNLTLLEEKFTAFDSDNKGFLSKEVKVYLFPMLSRLLMMSICLLKDLERFVEDWFRVRAESMGQVYEIVNETENPLASGIELTDDALPSNAAPRYDSTDGDGDIGGDGLKDHYLL
jgi:hypothetical protein